MHSITCASYSILSSNKHECTCQTQMGLALPAEVSHKIGKHKVILLTRRSRPPVVVDQPGQYVGCVVALGVSYFLFQEATSEAVPYAMTHELHVKTCRQPRRIGLN